MREVSEPLSSMSIVLKTSLPAEYEGDSDSPMEPRGASLLTEHVADSVPSVSPSPEKIAETSSNLYVMAVAHNVLLVTS